jgi:tetratricopeptide (TPR) repeat protein
MRWITVLLTGMCLWAGNVQGQAPSGNSWAWPPTPHLDFPSACPAMPFVTLPSSFETSPSILTRCPLGDDYAFSFHQFALNLPSANAKSAPTFIKIKSDGDMEHGLPVNAYSLGPNLDDLFGPQSPDWDGFESCIRHGTPCHQPVAPSPSVSGGPRHWACGLPPAFLSKPALDLSPRKQVFYCLPVNQTKLRELAHVPCFRLRCMDFNLASGPDLSANVKERQDPAKRIATLRQSLRGDASDAESYLELSGLYQDGEHYEEACTKARDLFLQRLQADPTNGWLRAQYAGVLWTQVDEAEAQAHAAVRCAPGDWRCWKAWSVTCYRKMLTTLFGASCRLWDDNRSVQEFFDDLTFSNPGPEALARAEKLLHQAARCMDKAVSLGRDECEAYQSHAAIQCAVLNWHDMFGRLHNRPVPNWVEEFRKTHLIRDARRMVRLCPDNPECPIFLARTYFIAAVVTRAADKELQERGFNFDDPKELWHPVPVALKQGEYRALRQLAKLSHHQDPVLAGTAARYASHCCCYTGDVAKAERWAKRAVALDPKCQKNWDVLFLCQDQRGANRELYYVCKKQLKHFPTVRNSLLFASACADLQLLDKAEKVLRHALEQHPDDAHCRLGLAAVLLRKSAKADSLVEAKQCLDQVADRLNDEDNPELAKPLQFHQAIYLALTGANYESCCLFETLSYGPSNEPTAKYASKAMAIFAAGGQ